VPVIDADIILLGRLNGSIMRWGMPAARKVGIQNIYKFLVEKYQTKRTVERRKAN
jgi:hypothetical protein